MCRKTHVNKCTLSTVTHVWKLLHPMVEVKIVFRTMKEMVQRQKDAVFSLGIEFSTKHPLFALFGATQ